MWPVLLFTVATAVVLSVKLTVVVPVDMVVLAPPLRDQVALAMFVPDKLNVTRVLTPEVILEGDAVRVHEGIISVVVISYSGLKLIEVIDFVVVFKTGARGAYP